MPSLLLPRRRFVQPQALTPLDRNNPLTRGIGFLWTGLDPQFEQITRAPASIVKTGETLAIPNIGPQGRSIVGSSTARSGWSAANLSTSADYTVAALVTTAPTTPNGGNPFDGDDINTYRWFQLSPTNNAFIPFSTSGSNFAATFPTLFVANKTEVYAGRCQSGVATAWKAGVSGSPVTVTGGNRGAGVAGASLCVGAAAFLNSNSQPYLGNVYLCAYWSRALSDAELREFSANPWQIFSPGVA